MIYVLLLLNYMMILSSCTNSTENYTTQLHYTDLCNQKCPWQQNVKRKWLRDLIYLLILLCMIWWGCAVKRIVNASLCSWYWVYSLYVPGLDTGSRRSAWSRIPQGSVSGNLWWTVGETVMCAAGRPPWSCTEGCPQVSNPPRCQSDLSLMEKREY